MITPNDASMLKSLYRSQEFTVLKKVAETLIERWHKETPTGDTQFNYLRDSLNRDGKILGVDEFLKEIEKISRGDYAKTNWSKSSREAGHQGKEFTNIS